MKKHKHPGTCSIKFPGDNKKIMKNTNIIYSTKSKTKGQQVELCESNSPDHKFAVTVDNKIKATTNDFKDAYSIYNNLAR